MTDTHRVEITGIANGGEGVGRLPDGRVTFVHRTAVGDSVDVRITESRSSWTRSELVEVVRPGPARQAPPCPHYDTCGGCALQHIEYAAQREAKQGVVQDALTRIGKLDVDVPPVEASPREYRYRNRLTFTLRRTGQGVVAGFHRIDDPATLLDVTAACLLPEAPITDAWRALRSAWGDNAARLPSGEELRLTLRANEVGATGLMIDGGFAPGRPEELLDAVPGLVAVWHRPEGRKQWTHRAGREELLDAWAGDAIDVSGDLFTQVNREAAERLEAHVLERVRGRGPGTAVDAYSGVASYGRRLEADGWQVTAIESHPAAVSEIRRAETGITVLEGRVEERLAEALPADLVILNPPRSGVHEAVTDVLAENGPDHVVYVSCDPATLARDLRRLSPAYEVNDIRCFDLFPQTAHVETVVELERCATT